MLNNAFTLANSIRLTRVIYYILLFIVLGIAIPAISQDTVSNQNLTSRLELEKYFTIHHPNALVLSTMKMKSRDGNIYILNDNFISGTGLALFTINLQSNTIDTNYIPIDDYAINLSDFDVCEQKLYLFISNEFIEFDLQKRDLNTIKIGFPKRLIYKHFYLIDINNIIFYEWQIGDKRIEDKPVYIYHIKNKTWEIIENQKLDGLSFLAINSHDKHIDVNSMLLTSFKPDRYEIFIRNINTGAHDTLHGGIDSIYFISGDKVRNINDKYRILGKSYLFDSLDIHCQAHSRLFSIRSSGDSIIYVSYIHKYKSCDNQTKKYKNTEFLDIWYYNKQLMKWELYIGGLRLDNRSGCDKKSISELKNLYYTLYGIEANWCVLDNYLIIPKKMPDKLDINGDISPYYIKENFNGGLNLQIMIFKLSTL